MPVSFIDKFKTIRELFLKPKVFNALISQKHFGFLKDVGWFESFESGKPVDQRGKPLPWLTYSFISFLTPRLNNHLKIFEYGAGNSTLYFLERVKQVVAVEHDKTWYEQISKMITANTTIIFRDGNNQSEYVSSILDTEIKFNIVLVDAIFRVECLGLSLKVLEEDGVIILDDSERSEYTSGIDFLISQGFRRLDFWGISPGYLYRKCTSVFYKDKNCLNI